MPLRFVLAVLSAVISFAVSAANRRRALGPRGQATAEYALVLLGAATVALLLVAWATKTGKVTALLDAVVDQILDKT